MSFILVKVTYPNIKEANKTIHYLLKNRLISSANSFPIKSTSSWTGKIQEVNEVLVLFNTRKENWNKVKHEIRRLHTYKVPCIAKINAEANKEYEDWIKRQTKSL